MTILILEDKACNNFGGAEKSMYKYAQHLKKSGHKVILIYQNEGSWLTTAEKQVFRKIYRLNTSSPKSQKLLYPISLLKFIYYVKINGVSHILTHTVHSFPLIKLVKSVTNVKVIAYFKWVVNYQKIGLLNKWGLSCIDHAIANSQFVLDYWQPKLLKNYIKVVPNGIEIPFGVNINSEAKKIKNLLFVGRIYEGKGLHILIEVLNEFKHLKLIICGKFDPAGDHTDHSYHKKIMSLIDKLKLGNRVHFKGYTNPLPFMTSDTLVVIPSIWPESASRVLYESMLTCTSVIASNNGGMSMILKDLNNVLSFTPTVRCLKNKIENILKLDITTREEHLRNLYDVFKKYYTIDKTQAQIDTLLKY